MDVPPPNPSGTAGHENLSGVAARAKRAMAERTGGLSVLETDDWRALVVGSLLIGLALAAARLVGPHAAGAPATRTGSGEAVGAGPTRQAGGPATAGDRAGGPSAADRPLALSPAGPASPRPGPGPGTGVVVGRLVDAVTGLPVPDAGVLLLGREARTISAPDGRFRFGGVPAGTATVIVGPADGFVARSETAEVAADGVDLGIVPLLPMTFSALITPDFGGRVAPCDGSTVDFATQAFVESTAVWATCLRQPSDFPAPAPPGRLPLAVLDLSPGDVRPDQPLRVKLALPMQPRYAAGVQLDVLRLDLEQLVWLPVGSLAVDAGGATASGSLGDMGTFLVAAPPYGALASSAPGPQLTSFAVHDAGALEPVQIIQAGKLILYAAFDYAGLNNTPIMVRTVDADGNLVFESRRPYTDAGHDDMPMTAGDRSWPPGDYTTTIYQGDPPQVFASQTWRVALSLPTSAPPPTLPVRAIAFSEQPSDFVMSPVEPTAVSICTPPARWWARIVQAGDTLTDLARRSGSTVAALAQANCLSSDQINIGQLVYLPRPPLAAKPAGIPGPSAWQPPGYKPIFGGPLPAPRYGPNPGTYPTATPIDHSTRPGAGWPIEATPAPKYATAEPGNLPPEPTLAPAPWGNTGGQGGGAAPRLVPPPAATPEAPPVGAGSEPRGGAPTLAPPKQTRPPDPTLAPRP